MFIIKVIQTTTYPQYKILRQYIQFFILLLEIIHKFTYKGTITCNFLIL